jgi:hypothetical protein
LSQDPHTVDAKAYNALVARASLRNIRLVSCKLDLKEDALGIPTALWRRRLNENIETFSDLELSQLYGMFRFELACSHGRKRMLIVTGTYLVAFTVDGESHKAAGELFVERVGRIAAYPYFRGLVAQLVSDAGITLPPLPIISAAPRTIRSAQDLEVKGAAKVLSGT